MEIAACGLGSVSIGEYANSFKISIMNTKKNISCKIYQFWMLNSTNFVR